LFDPVTLYKIIFLLFAASLPLVVFIAVGRQLVSAFRSVRNRWFRFALYSVLAIVGILLLFAGLLVVWFVYGVGHSAKDIFHELVLVIVTALLIYGASYGLWRFARHIDSMPGPDTD
jgi:hypothetical protein